MRRKKLFLGLLFLTGILSGCGKEEKKEELLPASKEAFTYEVAEGVNQITVDEEGLLYTVELQLPESSGPVLAEDYVYHPPVQKFCVYDLEGNCIGQAEAEIGSGWISVMSVQNGTLYCVASSEGAQCVYAVDTGSWEVTRLAELKGFRRMTHMVPIGDYLYLLGNYTPAATKTYLLHPDVEVYYYGGEQICRINVTEPEPRMELMSVDFPIGIYGTAQDTLIIYQYTEEKGFGFLEFRPQEVTLTEAGWKNTDVSLQNLSGCGEGFLFRKDLYLYYGTVDGMEAQLLPDRIYLKAPAVYQKGFAFFMNSEKNGRVERICVEDIVQENKEIRLLMHDSTMDTPYGCGFLMEKKVLSAEEFALKVLAQDQDFDAYLLSSRKPCAYNLQKNGVFYPLNDVEGVQEYLDACFPYVKELAVNEDGEIWMLPVGLAIPGLLYNKEYCAENDVDYGKMDFLEFLSFTKDVEAEQPDQTSMSLLVTVEELFGQYLKVYDTFDTDVFRSYARKIQEIYREQGAWKSDTPLDKGLSNGEIPDFYHEYEVYSYGFSVYEKKLGTLDVVGICGVPGIAEGIGNVGTITFLAVNPQSENLEATLDYISTFARYMMTKQNSFMLEDESTYTDTPFVHEWYELYAGGSINFVMDTEVYWNTFNEYIKGEIELEAAIAEMERRRKLYLGE